MSRDLDHLGWLIKRAQHGHHRALDLKLAALGITLVQWNALREIHRNPGNSQQRLAEQTFNSPQAFGTLVTRLMDAGWVSRTQGGGRVTLHGLTAAGADILASGQRVMTEVLTASFAPLTRVERAELTRLLEKMRPPD